MAHRISGTTYMRYFQTYRETEVTVPGGVTQIAHGAFQECKELKKIVIPDGIRTIPDNCFEGCERLETVVLPGSLTEIGDRAFCDCKRLRELTLPENLKAIGYGAFWNCESLESIRIPPKVTNVGGCLFRECTRLSEIIACPDPLTTGVMTGLYSGWKNLQTFTIPEGVRRIDNYAFDGCTHLQSIVIPESVEFIGYKAFQDCWALKHISLPHRRVELCDLVFSKCQSLETVDMTLETFYTAELVHEHSISASTESLKARRSWVRSESNTVFQGTNLKTIHFYRDEAAIAREKEEAAAEASRIQDEGIFTEHYCRYQKLEKGLRLLDCMRVHMKELTVNPATVEIGRDAFARTRSIDRLVLDLEPVTIDISPTWHLECKEVILGDQVIIKDHCFDEMLSQNYVISSSHCLYAIWNHVVYVREDGALRVAARATDTYRKITLSDECRVILPRAFMLCGLQEITLPQGLETIGEEAFAFSQFSELSIPEGVKEVPEGMVRDCRYLKRVVLPDSVIRIAPDFARGPYTICCYEGSYAERFAHEHRMKVNVIRKRDEQAETFEPFALGKGRYAHTIVAYQGQEKQLHVPETVGGVPVNDLGDNLFSGKRFLEEVWIPGSISRITRPVFADCKGLMKLHLAEGVTNFSLDAVDGCNSLMEIELPATLTGDPGRMYRHYSVGSAVFSKWVTIVGKRGSEACMWAEREGLPFVDPQEPEALQAICRQFVWKKVDGHVVITRIYSTTNVQRIVVPDTIDGSWVTEIRLSADVVGTLVLGEHVRNLEGVDCILNNMEVPKTNRHFYIMDGCLYRRSDRTMLTCFYNRNQIDKMVIQEGTVRIESFGKYRPCVSEIHFPRSIRELPMNSYWYWSDSDCVFCGYPDTPIERMADAWGRVFVDLALSEQEREAVKKFGLKKYNDKNAWYATACDPGHKEITIPDYVGAAPVTGILSWMERLGFVSCDRQSETLSFVRAIHTGAFNGVEAEEVRIPEGVVDIGNLFAGSASCHRLVLPSTLEKVTEGTISNVREVVISPTRRSLRHVTAFLNCNGILLRNEEGKIFARFAGVAMWHLYPLDESNPKIFRILDSHTIDEWKQEGEPFDADWLVRRHDEAFDDLDQPMAKLYAAAQRLTLPWKLSDTMRERYSMYLRRTIRKVVQVLVEGDERELLVGLCQAGVIDRKNARNLVAITGAAKRTDLTALILAHAK